ncbi:putative ferric-chelate reductase 1 [Cheilinus undulatus]|uniref:putative ferric-chelate reductase 1 n=1 Tax=Cheilinus undulatus TaxID=241271 RepID=UPI001BD5E47C|nr:putative ferric-chelate reductase 1 [Cheilinus undulatus]
MERGLILLAAAALMVYVAPGVQGTFHLSFANNTEVNITRDGCGMSKLCVETPDNCDPSTSKTCSFASLTATTPVAPDGTNVSCELSGSSSGYMALGLTANASEGTTMLFICAQNSSNNGSFFFRTMQRNNTDGALTPTERITREIRGTVNGSVIMCEFDIPNVNASMMRNTAATTFMVLVGNGTFDGTMLGPFNTLVNSGSVNIADPLANVANTTTTTMAPGNATTASGCNINPNAMLLFLSIFTLPAMLRA